MQTPKNSCRVIEGRLMQIDVAAGYHSVGDVDDMIEMIRAEFARVPGPQIVIAADWRPCKLFSPEVADRARAMLSSVSPRVERSAILHREDAATSVLQVMRLIREVKFEHRRVFTDPAKMQEWLGELLNERERAQLEAFLAQRH
jgi:hypothetical protein